MTDLPANDERRPGPSCREVLIDRIAKRFAAFPDKDGFRPAVILEHRKELAEIAVQEFQHLLDGR
jgi:hypothetical protein